MKIFGIGLSKTGTQSLAKALSILGYKTIHYPWSMDDIRNYDASLDIPVACRYEELDILYPNSKFILTMRPFDEWLERRRTKPADLSPPPDWRLQTRIMMYGSIKFDEKLYTEAYYKHHNNVEAYFRDRKDDLLIMHLSDNNKWKTLCEFLNQPIPCIEYPWEGKSIHPLEKHCVDRILL